MGYRQAGFNVTGVDLHLQPRYPFRFIQADALTVDLSGFDAIHASPPCQRYSRMVNCRPGLSEDYPDLIGPIRKRLIEQGTPWVIENVPGSPLLNPVMLCGAMFGRQLYRHRLFESTLALAVPPHPRHVIPASRAGHWVPGTVFSVSGNCSPVSIANDIMGIDWMIRTELVESIPPYFTEYLGKQL